MMSQSPAELAFAALLSDAVALNGALGAQRWPQARHFVRMLATRAPHTGHPEIRTAALDLLATLDASIHPEATAWRARLNHLNGAIDRALDDADGQPA
ncbi:hypothetical protein [Dyella sp. 333MFSha]|uniref:hypothetical protein n=1 Tax=Dyella sp. 333MFSha TaxID=1798240 RepID=UPI00088B1961|nr:hypothetical protein [Dyella sp. 333MFSha]SDG06261.1 hypothetical protein SAMN04515659_2016 [Dyella sp. 333MFSha]